MTSAQTDRLWHQFKSRHCSRARAQLIEQHVYLCKATAARLMRGLPPSIEAEDLVGVGLVGLVKAVDGFDPRRGIRFTTYAIALIRGTILTMLRDNDWVPRLVREQEKQLAQAEDDWERQHGRSPEEAELAAHMDWTPDYLSHARRAIEQARLVSLDADVYSRRDKKLQPLADLLADHQPSTWERLWGKERSRLLAQAIARLPEREGRVVCLYYCEGKTFREIGPTLGISESRAYQLHVQAMRRLQQYLGADWEA